MNHELPLVSIIVVTYNSDKYVLETLESAKAQTYKNIELIVTDDYSTDTTLETCRIWIEKNRERFVNVTLLKAIENTGISANVNRGLKASDGIWIKYIAGDDILASTCIEKNISVVNENPDEYILLSALQSFKDGTNEFLPVRRGSKYYKGDNYTQYKNLVKYDCFVNVPTLFIKKELFNKIGYIDEEIVLGESYATLIRATKAGFKLKYFDSITVLYRVNHKSVSSAYSNTFIGTLKKIDEKYRLPWLKSHAPLWFWHLILLRISQKAVNGRNKILKGVKLFSPIYLKILFKKNFKKLLVLVAGLSILFNLLFFYVDIFPFIRNYHYTHSKLLSTTTIDQQAYNALVLNSSKELINKYQPQLTEDPKGFARSLRNKMISKDANWYNWSERAFLLYGIIKYAESINDTESFEFVKTVFDTNVLNESVRNKMQGHIDPSTYGLISSELYVKTGKQVYKNYSDSVLQMIKENYHTNGHVLYNNKSIQCIDGLGMFCPFLFDYHNKFNDTIAENIAESSIESYQKFGVDIQSGIPAHGFNIETNTKVGLANWGRGMGWYALSLAWSKDSINVLEQRFINTLAKLDSTGNMTSQWPGYTQNFDASSTAMFYFYLNHRGVRRITKNELYELFCPYTTEKGLIYYSSGSPTLIAYPKSFVVNQVTQGLYLLLLAEIERLP